MSDLMSKGRKMAADDDSGGSTCSVCGASIERDPAGEEPRTWHHNDGDKHDHEAKPSGGDKESRRRVAADDDFPWATASADEKCAQFKRLDERFGTSTDSPLHHDNRCPVHGDAAHRQSARTAADDWYSKQGDPAARHEYVGTSDRCRVCGFTDNHVIHSKSKSSARKVAASLNDLMEFDHPVVSDGNGNVTDAPSGIYAPEVYVDLDDEGQMTSLNPSDISVSPPWTLLNGFSGQSGYGGPIMHDSEYIGGGLERYIRENAGVYVSVVVTGMGGGDPEDDVVGWAVAYQPGVGATASRKEAKDSYDDWMNKVDAAVQAKAGLSVHDLADAPFMDWYEDGVSPSSAAGKAIRNDREGMRRQAYETEGPYKVQVAGSGENVWSENALRFQTPEEAKAYASDLLGRWFGADMARVVSSDTPTRAAVDPADSQIVINYRTGARRRAMRKGAPFADYKDFADCVSKNADKDDPEAYCGKIKHQVEDGKTSRRAIAARSTEARFTESVARELHQMASLMRGGREAAKYRGDLDRSVAFTILLDVWPEFGSSTDDGGKTITAFLNDWYEDPGTDMYAFAKGWVQGKTATLKQAGNPYAVGSPAWFRWESGEGDPETRGPSSGVPRDIFPEGGVPLYGDLTPEQEAWMKSRKRSTRKRAADDYKLECYGCGKKGTNEDFGMGNKRQCPSCGSYEVHSPEAHENWKPKSKSSAMRMEFPASRRTARSLSEVASEIRKDWRPPNYAAAPYLEAMLSLDSMSDNYGAESASSIVAYFLSNASQWKGETAKRIKAELRSMQKGGAKTASNYYLDMIEDSNGDLVDIDYYHNFCAPPEVKAKGDWPAPEFPDYDVYCAGCGELIHGGIDSEARFRHGVTDHPNNDESGAVVTDHDQGAVVRDPRNPRGLYGGDRNILLQDRALDLHDEEKRNQLELRQLERGGARSDYAHHNEDADYMWYQEEGRFSGDEDPPEDDPYDDDGGDWAHEGGRRPFGREGGTIAHPDPDGGISSEDSGMLIQENWERLRDEGLSGEEATDRLHTLPEDDEYTAGLHDAGFLHDLLNFGNPDKWGEVKWEEGESIEDAPTIEQWRKDHGKDATTHTALGQCSECGHQHYDGATNSYVPCPLRDEGCPCPYADGDEHTGARTAMPAPGDVGVKVGDFFCHSWGYDQTNIDFYEVTGLTGQSVKVRLVNNDATTIGGDTSMMAKVVPIPGSYRGPEMTKRVLVSGHDGEPYLKQPYGWCGLWNGEPRTETSYG